jgi:hypothetical protein
MRSDGRMPIMRRMNGMIEWMGGGYTGDLPHHGHVALVALLHTAHISAPRVARILAALQGHHGQITDADIRVAIRAAEGNQPTQQDIDRVRAALDASR